MAFGVVVLGGDNRARLATVLRALLIAQLVLSLLIVLFCYNTTVKVLTLLKEVHKVRVLLLMGLIACQTYGMKLQYSCGLRLVASLLHRAHWHRVQFLAKALAVAGSLSAANSLLVYAACSSTMKALMKELSSSIKIGISQYLVDKSWKTLLDTMQIELECCGAESSEDWRRIPWLSVDSLRSDQETLLAAASVNGCVSGVATPFSCCTPHVLAACYHDPLQQWQSSWQQWSTLQAASLHALGCVEALRRPLTTALTALKCYNLLVVVLQAVIVVLVQLLRTSAGSAVLRGDAGGEGTSALWGGPRVDPHHAARRRHSVETAESGSGTCASHTLVLTSSRRNKYR